jgi:hypothetical protein
MSTVLSNLLRVSMSLSNHLTRLFKISSNACGRLSALRFLWFFQIHLSVDADSSKLLELIHNSFNKSFNFSLAKFFKFLRSLISLGLKYSK